MPEEGNHTRRQKAEKAQTFCIGFVCRIHNNASLSIRIRDNLSPHSTLFFKHPNRNFWQVCFLRFYAFSLDINTTHSTCPVRGKKSAARRTLSAYPRPQRYAASRAAVAGLHEIMTIRFGDIVRQASSVTVSQPLRGGSSTIISGCVPSAANFAAISPASPA